jgi:antitoxin FitA
MRFPCGSRCIQRATCDTLIGMIPFMAGAQLIDMSDTSTNVLHMSKMIQIRNVPDDMHRALKMSAAAEGISLSDYIKRELGGVTAKASLEEIDARIRARGPSKVRGQTILRILRESRGD